MDADLLLHLKLRPPLSRPLRVFPFRRREIGMKECCDGEWPVWRQNDQVSSAFYKKARVRTRNTRMVMLQSNNSLQFCRRNWKVRVPRKRASHRDLTSWPRSARVTRLRLLHRITRFAPLPKNWKTKQQFKTKPGMS